MSHPPAIGLIACEVFSAEIALATAGATHILHTRMLEIGLHDRPDEMRAVLQSTVNELDRHPDITAIVLSYGLCGLGTAGLRAGKLPLIIPRAHDCITVFLGSKERCAHRRGTCPESYHFTPGWNRARRVPGPDRLAALRAEYSEKFDEDDTAFLLESERSMWAAYHTATFIDTGTPDASAEAAYTQSCADWLGWKFEHIQGDPTLLSDLLHGKWDPARFQIIAPGQHLAHSADAAILRAVSPP